MKWLFPLFFAIVLASCEKETIQYIPAPSGPSGSIYDTLVGYEFYSPVDVCEIPGKIWNLYPFRAQFLSKDTVRYFFNDSTAFNGEYEILRYESGRMDITWDGPIIKYIMQIYEVLPNGDIYGRRNDSYYCPETFFRSPL